MATQQHITSKSTQNTCRVAAALARKLAAGEDDDESYNQAMLDIMTLPATSLAGIAAKVDALCWFLDTIEDLELVDAYVSWDSINALRAGIQQGLLQLQHG